MNTYTQIASYLWRTYHYRFASYFEACVCAEHLINCHGEAKMLALLNSDETFLDWVDAIREANDWHRAQIPALIEAEKQKVAAWKLPPKMKLGGGGQ